MTGAPDVQPGQVWADCDARSAGRTLLVLSVADGKATCQVETNDDATQKSLDAGDPSGGKDRRGASTLISVSRFLPTSTGYRLVGRRLAPVPFRALLVNTLGGRSTTHIDSGRRSTVRGVPAAVALCGRYLDRFALTSPTTDAPTCGQCTRRKEN